MSTKKQLVEYYNKFIDERKKFQMFYFPYPSLILPTCFQILPIHFVEWRMKYVSLIQVFFSLICQTKTLRIVPLIINPLAN